MRQRHLLIIGVLSVGASLVLGATGVATGFLGGRGGEIGINRAVQIAQNAATSYPGGDLKADEVIGFSRNYYASVREKGSGIGAFEILIDRTSGSVTREPGPDMMWTSPFRSGRRAPSRSARTPGRGGPRGRGQPGTHPEPL